MTTQPAQPEIIIDAAVAALRETAVAEHPSAALVERTIAAMQSHGGRPGPAGTAAAGARRELRNGDYEFQGPNTAFQIRNAGPDQVELVLLELK